MGVITNQWKSPVYLAIDPAIPNLKKVGGGSSWNAGAISRRFLPALAHNHGCRWKAVETNKHRMCGLSGNADSNQSYTDIEFAWFVLADGTLQIYESGTLQLNSGTYTANEVLEVNLEDLGDTRIFVDDFNGGSLDLAKWDILTPGSSTTISQSGGKLYFNPSTSTTGYNILATDNSFDLTDRSFVVDITEFPYQTGYNDSGILLTLTGTVDEAVMVISGGTLYCRIFNSGVQTQSTYGCDTSQVSKFRMRYNATENKIYYSTYHNTNGWQNHVSYTPTWSLTSVKPGIICGNWYAYNPVYRFGIDNAQVEGYNGTGFLVKYYRTPDGGSRTLHFTSNKPDSYIKSLLPLRIDTSIYDEDGTIENVEYLGANWLDEKGKSVFPARLGENIFTPEFKYWQKIMSPYFGGGGGGPVTPPVTVGQIYPRGIKS